LLKHQGIVLTDLHRRQGV